MTDPRQWRLGIDFGSTHTVATLAGPQGVAQPLLFEAGPLLSSAVYAEPDGRLLVGRDAERSARLDPGRFEPNPKRRVDDGRLLLGDREYPVAEVFAAVLRRVVGEASRVAGLAPGSSVITFPAAWGPARRAVLTEAAERAGVPQPTLVPEPIAAAVYFTETMGVRVPAGASIVVYDLGGGTCDVSVLRLRPEGGWELRAADGCDVGGLDLDATVVGQFGSVLAARDPAAWRRLTNPADDADRRARRLFWDDVRAAKEQLSRASSAVVHVPVFETDLHVTREEFERLARPYLERTADLTAATMQRAGLRADQVAGLFLVGGSSRIPLVGTLLHHRLGVAPTVIEQPELVVAQGAPRCLPTPQATAPMPGTPVSGGPLAGSPMSGAPVSPTPTPPVPGSPTSPVSGASPVGGPSSAPGAPVPPPFGGLPSGAPGTTPWPPPGAPGAAPWPPPKTGRRVARTVLAVTVVAVLLVCGTGATVTWNVFRNLGDRGTSGGQHPAGLSGPGGGTGGGRSSGSVAKAQTAKIDRAVWYSGFKLTFGTATYTPDELGGKITLEVAAENLSDRGDQGLLLPIVYSEGDVHTDGRTDGIVMVPGKATTRLRFVFSFFDRTKTVRLPQGRFTLGVASSVQAVIPVDPKAPGFDPMEPRPVLPATKFQIGKLGFDVSGCELRPASYHDHRPAQRDTRVLWCGFAVRGIGLPDEGRFVGAENFRVKLPDGTTNGPMPTSAPSFALYPNGGPETGEVEWSVPWPGGRGAPGQYVMQFSDLGFLANDAVAAQNTRDVPVTL